MFERHRLQTENEVNEFLDAIVKAKPNPSRAGDELRLDENDLTDKGPIRDYYRSEMKRRVGA